MGAMMDYITEKELATYLTQCGLPTSKKYLEKLRAKGKGPVFKKWGRSIVYARQDVTQWVMNRTASSYTYTKSSYERA